MTPLVIAHRGASWDLPENTLPAIERAIEAGADFVEIDVHAADGRLAVVHDPPQPGRAYPELEEVVALTSGRIGLMVELKHPYRYRRDDPVRRTLALLDDDAVLVCFAPGALLEARRLRPRLRLLQHVGFGVSIDAAAGYAWGAGFGDDRVTPRGIARARAHGLAATVFTVNEPARMRELAGYGATGIFTDRPELALRVLRAPSEG
ncbi:MAG TPA: glycerophosphodiester phosphodiesterase [Gaiellaceae bacterium]|nr:glycerophosphodiester phosphodiesterase [Gaiellaceae bacterium]